MLDRHPEHGHRPRARLGVLRIVVFAQELVPGNDGMIAGVFFGLMFGFGGIGAALLGHLADLHGIEYAYRLCATCRCSAS